MTTHLRRYYNAHGNNGWVLKCDIHHYFQSIRHDVAKAAIHKRVKDTDIAARTCEIVDSFGDIGLGLGSQVSQLVALAVLDDLDHYIKERLRVKHYVRYMDDFILVHHDKAFLKYCRTEIEKRLNSLGLQLNNKTSLYPLRQGVKLLQWRFIVTDTGA
ncbi:MAG: RNA-directed DNA polymerase, partial [Acutalibacteraceae bacterium]